MTVNPLQVAALAALILAGGSLIYLQGDNVRQVDEIARLGRDASRDKALISSQANALSSIQQLQRDVAAINASGKAMQQTISAQSSAISRSLEELKRNDQAISDYLNSPVPAVVGVRWQRAESVDPIKYRQSSGMQPDAVSPASPASPKP